MWASGSDGVVAGGQAADRHPDAGVDLGRAGGLQDHVVHAPVGGDDGEAALGDDQQHRLVGAGRADQAAQVAGVRQLAAAVDQDQVAGRAPRAGRCPRRAGSCTWWGSSASPGSTSADGCSDLVSRSTVPMAPPVVSGKRLDCSRRRNDRCSARTMTQGYRTVTTSEHHRPGAGHVTLRYWASAARRSRSRRARSSRSTVRPRWPALVERARLRHADDPRFARRARVVLGDGGGPAGRDPRPARGPGRSPGESVEFLPPVRRRLTRRARLGAGGMHDRGGAFSSLSTLRPRRQRWP